LTWDAPFEEASPEAPKLLKPVGGKAASCAAAPGGRLHSLMTNLHRDRRRRHSFLVALPEARIGIIVNLFIIAALVVGQRFEWL
jgi:hypothetical protein